MKTTIDYKKTIKNFITIFFGNLLLAIAISFCLINYKGSHIYGFDENNNPLMINFNGIIH